MYKSILIPIDIGNSDNATRVIETAAAQGGADAEITLLNVVEEIPRWALVELPKDTMEKSVNSSQDKLQAISDSTEANTHAEIRVGHPYKTILQVAEEKNADLIVVASHQPGSQNFFLGSTAAKVVRHAHCSVLVVR